MSLSFSNYKRVGAAAETVQQWLQLSKEIPMKSLMHALLGMFIFSTVLLAESDDPNTGSMAYLNIKMGAFQLGTSFPVSWDLVVSSPLGATLVGCELLETGDKASQIDSNSVSIKVKTYGYRDQVIIQVPSYADVEISGGITSNNIVPGPMFLSYEMLKQAVPGYFHFEATDFNDRTSLVGWLTKSPKVSDPKTCSK